MNILEKIKKEQCTGCSACASLCPEGSLRMEVDEQGFFYPAPTENTCVNCGACVKSCHALRSALPDDDICSPPAYYCGRNADDAICMASASGGIFSLFAEKVLERGGIVCGAAFDDTFMARHIIIDSLDDLPALRGSKYMESSLEGIFPSLEEALENGREVLFSGTTCQVAGLRHFLQRDYQGLMLIDVMCHGIPSRLVFKRYMDELSEGGTIVRINFRDKDVVSQARWERFRMDVVYPAHEDPVSLRTFHDRNIFMNAFSRRLILRPSCSLCPVNRFPRPSDITLGDLQSVDKMQATDISRGFSVVAVNSKKGDEAFSQIRGRMCDCHPFPVNMRQYSMRTWSDTHPNRELFFRRLARSSGPVYFQIRNALRPRGKKVCLLGPNPYGNYAALFSSYAMQSLLGHLGFEPYSLDLAWESTWHMKHTMTAFRHKFPLQTRSVELPATPEDLNQHFDTFLVGPGDVWAPHKSDADLESYFLSFARDDKNIVAYGASFGWDWWRADPLKTEKMRDLAIRFTGISVRGDASQGLCNFFLNMPADIVLDPVLMLPEGWFNEITPPPASGPAVDVAAIFTLHAGALDGLKQICAKAGRSCMDLSGINRQDISPEEWLGNIRQSRLIITDSYDGLLFAFLFGKQFSFLNTNGRSQADSIHLLRSLDLLERVSFTGMAELDLEKISSVCFQGVQQGMQVLRENSIVFLKQNLE